MVDWQPTSKQSARLARDQLYRQIRSFFQARQTIEVDPPLLGRGGSTDVHLHALTTQVDQEHLYLQTSPEFFMKRLLAADSGPIYAITKSFRAGEQGRYHNLEFTLLEWYQTGFTDRDLMAQVAELIEGVLGVKTRQCSYSDCFLTAVDLNPHSASLAALANVAKQKLDLDWADDKLDRDAWLELIFSHCIQPTLQDSTLVYDYPASQAALAKIENNEEGQAVARRFELFYRGVELGNGYHELTDGAEQLKRFELDKAKRKGMGLNDVELDQKLVSALNSGMPECAGMAIGLDRLLMVKLGANELSEVIDFPLTHV